MQRHLIFSDSSSNGRAMAVAPKLGSKDEAPPFPDPQRCPFCVPHPRGVRTHLCGGGIQPDPQGSTMGPWTPSWMSHQQHHSGGRGGCRKARRGRARAARDRQHQGPVPPQHPTHCTAPGCEITRVCGKAPHLATNTHMLSNIIS